MSLSPTGRVAAAAFGLAVLCLVPFRATLCQTLTAGHLDTKTLRITNLPSAPKLTLHVKGTFGPTVITYTGPDSQVRTENYGGGYSAAGEHVFQQGALSEYAPAGTWTLSSIELCTRAVCNTYEGSALTAIIPENTFQLINPNTDVVGPTVTSGTIVTTSIRSNDNALIRTTLTVQDSVAGATAILLSFGTGKSTFFIPEVVTDHPIKAAETIDVGGYCVCQKVPAGTYSVSAITIWDRAGNETDINTPSDLAAIFGSQTITVTD